MLGLELNDVGFDYSLLSEFRSRLVAGDKSSHLLDELLRLLKAKGWVKGGGKQRTDSTHVLAAVRKLNRLQVLEETLRHSLETLAVVAPDWLDDDGQRRRQYGASTDSSISRREAIGSQRTPGRYGL